MGPLVGTDDGLPDGELDGPTVGARDIELLGSLDGAEDGFIDGHMLGLVRCYAKAWALH